MTAASDDDERRYAGAGGGRWPLPSRSKWPCPHPVSVLSPAAAYAAAAMPASRARLRKYRAVNGLIHRSWAWMQANGAVGPDSRAAERFGSFGEGSILGFS